jgi:hypothetical protein
MNVSYHRQTEYHNMERCPEITEVSTFCDADHGAKDDIINNLLTLTRH